MKTIRILILEDDLATLAILLDKLNRLEDEFTDKNVDIAITILAEYTQVEEYINQDSRKTTFDIILLDRDCKACGSFHVLDLEKIDKDKIISISSIPEYNQQAKEKGISKIVHKDLNNLETLSKKVTENIKRLLDSR
jgi:hypothetical protein